MPQAWASTDRGNRVSAAPLVIETEHSCVYCDDKITFEQIKSSIGGKLSAKREANIKKVLPYINKYREDFGLDTCLKKAHFFAQVIHESNKFSTFEEYETWSYWNKRKKKANTFPGVFSNKERVFDSTMATSLYSELKNIFVIKDKDDKVLTKSLAEIKKILLDEKVKVVDKKLYAKFDQGEELLKTVKEAVKDKDGKEVEQTKFKVYLKNHPAFGVPLMSRMYGSFTGDRRGLGNGDELSQDGWKYKGRGLKQLTGKGNYQSFAKYRNRADVSFPGDTSGDIDFTLNPDTCDPQDIKKGNYVKIAEPMYAVQSALYFWNAGTKYNKKYAVEHAENDDLDGVSKAVNRYDTGGFASRKKYYQRARKKGAFDITRHHKDIYDNGSEQQKKDAKAYFEKWKDDDDEAKKILEEINKSDGATEAEQKKPN